MCEGTSVMEPPWQTIMKDEFIYTGSCLGPFKVKYATIWECSKCGDVKILSDLARAWEVWKALEIIRKASFYSPLEMKFIRELCGNNPSELALALDVPAEDVLRWESSKGIGGSPGDSRRLARYFIRKENCLIMFQPKKAEQIRNKVRMDTED